MDYWRGPHSQLVARTPGFLEYRQHHFAAYSAGLWPALDGVETDIPEERRIDGTPEVWFDGPLGPLKGLKHNTVVFEDEQNVFGRTVLDITLPWDGRWFHTTDEHTTGFRAVVLLRRRPGARKTDLATLVHNELGPVLAASAGITELRTLVFAPYQRWVWNTPDVAHDYPVDQRFHAAVIIGARDEANLDAVLRSAPITFLGNRIRSTVEAIHAYPVVETYVYRRDGRPTLPQIKPEGKPRLDPARRLLPAAPTPSAAAGLPPSTVLPLPGTGPEDVVVDHQGRLLCGIEGGAILRIDTVFDTTEMVAHTGGRPLGLEVLADGRILVCDAHRGLLRVDPSTGSVEPLVQYVDGVPLRFCSNAAAAEDGAIWFTESTSRFDFEHYLGALLEHRPSGRLLRRDLDGTVDVVLENLHFANGVALTPDRTALLFNETGNYSLSRLWLTGPKQGTTEALLENLGGFPDNLSRFVDGRAWIAMTNPRVAALDALADRPGFLRTLVWKLPDGAQPPPETTVWALAIDPDGRVVDEVHGDHPTFHFATGAAEHGGKLYLASPGQSSLLTLELAGQSARSGDDPTVT
ncbi:SMP-30/gluconolactonase/LRE family protein [Rhodococcoides fascians]|uniref:SMP-30/gluconolactonase/LRE family protein n=1 Tax=Rhodococcoides fascians TaxID=1828 RepID=UPI0009B7F9E5|nr:SMP-30/gluconolactonase/LRE family protein [Rhodococcus fascians]